MEGKEITLAHFFLCVQKVNILENIPGHSRSRPVRRVMRGPGEMVAGWVEPGVRALGGLEGQAVGSWGESVGKPVQNNSGNLRTGGKGKVVLKPC